MVKTKPGLQNECPICAVGGLTPMRMLGNESYSSMNRLVPGSSPGRTAKDYISLKF